MFFKKEKNSTTINLPREILGIDGIIALPVNSIELDKSFSGTVLCVQDNPRNISDLRSIKNLHLQVKLGGVDTSCGMIIFILFIICDAKNKNDKFSYEVLLNPNDIESYEQYLKLDKQPEWELLMVNGSKVIKIYTFKNIYNIGGSINTAVLCSKNNPCLNFTEAKSEYYSSYSIEELIDL